MKKPLNVLLFIWITIVLLVLGCGIGFSSCEVLKTRNKASGDTTSVKKAAIDIKDSSANGSVTKTTTDQKDEYEKWKTTFVYPPRDTNVTNIYPSSVIYEREKGSSAQTTNTIDSSWQFSMQRMLFAYMDSMNRKYDKFSSTTHRETKGVGLVTLLLVLGGYFLLTKGGGFILSKYSITKKV